MPEYVRINLLIDVQRPLCLSPGHGNYGVLAFHFLFLHPGDWTYLVDYHSTHAVNVLDLV